METPTTFDGLDELATRIAQLEQENEQLKAVAPAEAKKKRAFKLPVIETTRLTENHWSGRVRFNLLKDVIEIRKKDSGQWVAHDAEAIAGFYIELGTAYDENPDKTVVIDTIRRMARANEYNPLVEYFEGLRHADADVYKFNNLASWAFGDDIKSPHANEILKLFLVAAVARTLEPGCYYRFCPVLLGEREIGKSFMANLAPFDLGNTTEPQANKYQIDQVLVAAKQSLILEISEADAFTKSVPHSIIKTFFSAGRSVTPIKNKNAQPFVRTWVVFGTSNLSNFIPNDLRRRFLPINLFHLKQGEFRLGDAQKLFDARDGIWAAAVQEYFRNWVGRELKHDEDVLVDLDAFTSDFVSESRWYEDCCDKLNFENRMFLSREQVKRTVEMGSKFTITDDQLNGFMQKHNWSMKRVRLTQGGKQQRMYVHPKINQYETIYAAYEAEKQFRNAFDVDFDLNDF